MMLRRKYIIFILLLWTLPSTLLKASFNNQRWRIHLSYNYGTNVVQTPNRVFVVASGSLFSVGKHDRSVEKYTRLTGLSGSNIIDISYSEKDDVLFIVYEDSNIDIMSSRGIFNMPDLARKNMAGSKRVNDIYFNDGFAYLSTDFGIAKVNIKKREFSDTYIIGENGTSISVNSMTIWNDSIYATSGNIIYSASIKANLSDFQNWKISVPMGENENFETIMIFNNKLLLLESSQKKVYTVEKQNDFNPTLFADSVISMNQSFSWLNLAKSTREISSYSNLSNPVSITAPMDFLSGFYDGNNNFYLAARYYGFIQIIQKTGSVIDRIQPNGPELNDPFTMKFTQGRLFVSTSGTWVSGNGNSYIPASISIYDDRWQFMDRYFSTDMPFISLIDIEVNPSNSKHFFASSFVGGLFEFKDDRFFHRYGAINSPIQPHDDKIGEFESVAGLAYDREGNLWITQSYVSDMLKVLKKDGTWKSFYISEMARREVFRLLIDDNNFKWINIPRSGPGIFVFDDNGTTTGRGRFRNSFIDQDNGSFTSLTYRCMTLDKEDPQKMWIGTANGPIIIPNTKKAFDSDFSIMRIKIPRNDGSGLADYLLENEIVNAIAVDGGNRKWLGTSSSGALLVSADGTETIYHFTTENSPLLSDNILSIAINPESGEVFFGTDQGIISFMGDATESNPKFKNVRAYPNPVRESYEGIISIVGLVDRTNVKITDTVGNLVYETTSNGGMATWDGKNVNGHRVSTGVYFALCSSEDGKEQAICKILVVNK